ncbi:MAG: hypothetical protein JWP81_2712 [Ferruginibacter sp.]|nr:hypothetical protein [Ferruginibacter sp.]
MITKRTIGLRIVLILMGLFIISSGLNIGLGGMLTLGWGGPNNFFEVTNMRPYLVQDSHVRFVGGIWLGIGLFFLIAATDLKKYKLNLCFSFALIFLGGLLRLAQMHFEITFGLPVVGSLIAELVGMPLLYLWLTKVLQDS